MTFGPLWCGTPPSENNYPSDLTCSVAAITVPRCGLMYEAVITETGQADLLTTEEAEEGGAGGSAASAQPSAEYRLDHSSGFKDLFVCCDGNPNWKSNWQCWVSAEDQVRRCGGGAGRLLQGLYGALIPLSFIPPFIPAFLTVYCQPR